jgi:hypothetical protein
MQRYVRNSAVALTMVFAGSCGEHPDTARLSIDSFGPIRVGMSIAEARRAAGVEMRGNLSSSECEMLHLVTDPGVQLMSENGKVTRIDITDAHHQTVLGIRIGDTEAQAQTADDGKLEIGPHKYDEHGHYLILRSPDKKSAMVFETDGKRIVRMRAGVVPSVEYVEGCG